MLCHNTRSAVRRVAKLAHAEGEQREAGSVGKVWKELSAVGAAHLCNVSPVYADVRQPAVLEKY